MSKERISFSGKVVKKENDTTVVVCVKNYGSCGDVHFVSPIEAEVGDTIRLTFEKVRDGRQRIQNAHKELLKMAEK